MNTIRIIIFFGMALFANLAFSAEATPKCIAEMVSTWVVQFRHVANILAIIAYISGVWFLFQSIIKFKENNETKGQVKMSVPILYFIASAMLLSLPTIMKLGIEAVIGQSVETVAFESDIASRQCANATLGAADLGVGVSAFGRGITLGKMFAAFTPSAQMLYDFSYYVAWVIGISMIIRSFYKFVQLSNNNQMGMHTPIVHFITGVGLISLTGTLRVLGDSVMTGGFDPSSNPGYMLAPDPGTSVATFANAAMSGVLAFLMFVGIIAVIRGWLLINQMAMGKEGVLGRGLTHIIGGILLINMHIFGPILARSFGWNV